MSFTKEVSPRLANKTKKIDDPKSNFDLNNIVDALLNQHNKIAGQVCNDCNDDKNVDCLAFLDEGSTQSHRASLQNALAHNSVSPLDLVHTLKGKYNNDELLQQGLVFLKTKDAQGKESAYLLKGRVDSKTFLLSDNQKNGLRELEKEGLTVSLHYIQNMFAIDIDLKEDGKKANVRELRGKLVLESGKVFEDHVNDCLMANDTYGSLGKGYLFARYETEHGFRLLFRITPTEVASTSNTPFSNKIKSVVSTNGNYTKEKYKGLCKELASKFGKKWTFERDGLTFEVIPIFDTDTPSGIFALYRLPNVIKLVSVGNKKQPVDIHDMPILFNDRAAPIPLHGVGFEFEYKSESTPAIVSPKSNPTAKALTTISQPQRKNNIFDMISSNVKAKKNEIENNDGNPPPHVIPSQWHDDDHRVDFGDMFFEAFMSSPMLEFYAQSPVMPYEAWRRILCNFKTLRKSLGEMSIDKSKEVFDGAKHWSQKHKTWSNDEKRAEANLKTFMSDSFESYFGFDKIQDAMGPQFTEWANNDPIGHALKQKCDTDAKASIYINAFHDALKQFKTKYQYDPRDGSSVIAKKTKSNSSTSQVGGDSGSDRKSTKFTPELIYNILRHDELLPNILKFSLAHNCFRVANNFSKVLSEVCEGITPQIKANVKNWPSLQDSDLVALERYLMWNYGVGIMPEQAMRKFLLAIQSSTDSQFDEKYKYNIFTDALKQRYADYKEARQNQETIQGHTDYLSNWLPTLLCVDPNKSSTHERLYKLWGAYGRAFLVQAAQRFSTTNNETTAEGLLFLRGSSGAGKTMLLKNIVASLFGTDVLSATNIDGFIATKSNLPDEKDKDQVSSLFGKLLFLLDDISTQFLRKNDQGAFKQFMSMTTDSVRMPYAKISSIVNRTFITVATSNNSHILNDLTSQRRNWIVDIDSVDDNGMYVCDLLDRTTLERTERKENKDGPCGFIDIQSSRILQLAFGQAYEVGVLGENLCDRKTIDGRIVPVKSTLMQFAPLDDQSSIGLHDLDRRISVEKPYLLQADQEISDKLAMEYQITQVDVDNNGHIFEEFLRNDIFGMGDKTYFETYQMKDFFLEKKRQVPSDNAIALWCQQGVMASDGRLYHFEKKRSRVDGKQTRIWALCDQNGKAVNINPFAVKISQKIDTIGYGPHGWGNSNSNSNYSTSSSNNWDASPDFDDYQNNNGGWGPSKY